MKTYLPTETKAERKARKAREKSGLSVEQPIIISKPASVVDTSKKYILCIKWGTKYDAEYVNKLYNMVKRNCTLDYEFICFTDNTKDIIKEVRCEPLPSIPVSGWWFKPWVLSNELPINGTALFLDLDLIIFRNIDKLFTHDPRRDFVIIRDFNRQVRNNWDRMNSSVFRFTVGKYNNQYQDFKSNPTAYTKRMQGDQDWMYKVIKNHSFFPDEWIQSYKWEMRGRDTLGVVNGIRNFIKPGAPRIPNQTAIAVFHGQPNMHQANDEWVKQNWY